MKGKSEVVKKGYNKIAKKYHDQRGTYPSKKILSKFLKNMKKGAEVLDIGCGAGVPVSRVLVKNRYKVTGIDFSESMVKLARNNVPQAKFIKMDMTKLKFIKNSFDGAVSFYAIIHVPREKHAKIYNSLHRILKPGGIIFVNPTGPDNFEGYEENYMGVPMFWSHYGPEKTSKIIENAGFEILWSAIEKLGNEKQFWVLARNKK